MQRSLALATFPITVTVTAYDPAGASAELAAMRQRLRALEARAAKLTPPRAGDAS